MCRPGDFTNPKLALKDLAANLGDEEIAIEGCSHGSLTTIYNTVARCEAVKGIKVDLLLLCGDFQALRNTADFESLAVPNKFRELGTFTDYYSGEAVAPILTIVIGGNHEASRYMWELYHGGWLAPNIYYLGAAGSVLVNGIRISGLSGIFKGYDYRTGHWETTPYDRNSVKSAYHVREYDVWKMLQLSPREGEDSIDLFMSHDWPVTITKHGDEKALLRRKSFFTEEVQTNTLGSPALLEILHHLKPRYWFSAHLHVKFSALVNHDTLLALENIGWSRAGRSKQMTQRRWEKSPARDTAYGGIQDVVMRAASMASNSTMRMKNPDAIELDSDEEEQPVKRDEPNQAEPAAGSGNPDEIDLEGDDSKCDSAGGDPPEASKLEEVAGPGASINPDSIDLDDLEDDEEAAHGSHMVDFANQMAESANPDFVALDDEDDEEGLKPTAGDESVDVVESLREQRGLDGGGIIGTSLQESQIAVGHAEDDSPNASSTRSRRTRFLALDKCGPGKDFLQILEIGPPSESTPPRLHFDPEWLAIVKATHPWFSLRKQPKPFPSEDELSAAMGQARQWVDAHVRNGVRAKGFADRFELDSVSSTTERRDGEIEIPSDVREIPKNLDPLDIQNVQRFLPTAAAEKHGGDHPARWYTNPQTLALCDFLDIPNVINPAPKEVVRSA